MDASFAPVAGERPLLGQALGKARLYVLDAGLEPVPVGVVGELHIGGVGLARGYLGLPGLTADRFVPDPFGSRRASACTAPATWFAGWRMARWSTWAVPITQVKIRGFRIEPGEIEATLGAQRGVLEAAVLAHEFAPGERELVAYVVLSEEGVLATLRESLARSLPDYMIPSAFVVLERLPLTETASSTGRACRPRCGKHARRWRRRPRRCNRRWRRSGLMCCGVTRWAWTTISLPSAGIRCWRPS